MTILGVCGFLCVLCGLCGSGFALDRNAFTFMNYQLEVRIDPQGQAITARGRITLRNDSRAAQKNAVLQISSSLEWRLIQVVGHSKEPQFEIHPYTTDIDHTGSVSEAVITLPSAVPPHGTVELEVGYGGSLAADTTRLKRMGVPMGASAESDWDQVAEDFTAVRGVGHVVWYPVSMEAANLSEGQLFPLLAEWQQREAESSMRARFCWITDNPVEGEPPAHLTVVANGQLENLGQGPAQSSEEGGSSSTGCAEYGWAPLGTAVPTFAVGNFQVLSRPAVNVYHLEQEGQIAADYAAAVEKVEPFLSGWFGAPREKVQVVELNDGVAAPFESGAMLFTPLRAAPAQQLEIALAHQLVHASFRSPRPWISEGLANFGQALEMEQQAGRAAALAYLGDNVRLLTEVESGVCGGADGSEAAAKPGACSYGQPLPAAYDEIYIRVKAMYVWWMLRDLVGDTALQSALAAYQPGKDSEPSYLQKLLEARSKRDLEWFFDDWVYRDRSLPDFRIAAAYARPLVSEGYEVTVTVEDLGQAGAQVPIVIHTAGGDMVKRLEVRGRSKATTRIQTPSVPTEVVVNDGSVPESNMDNNRFPLPAAISSPQAQ